MLIVLLKKTNYNTKVVEIDTKLSSLDGKITKNKKELNKIANNAVLLFLGNMLYNGEDGSQTYLIFQPIYRYFKTVTNTIFYHGNVEDYLLKILSHLQHLIIVLLQN